MKQNATRKCKQVQTWNLKRLTRKIKTGSNVNKQTAFYGREFALKNKNFLMKACLIDSLKSYSYYKDENDFNKKQDKLQPMIKKMIMNTTKWTPKKSKDMKKKILNILKS